MSIATQVFRGFGAGGAVDARVLRGFSSYPGLPQPIAAGFQETALTSLYSGAGFWLGIGASPPLSVGDIVLDQILTTPSSYTEQTNPDGTVEVFAAADTSRQTFPYYIYRAAAKVLEGPQPVLWNSHPPVWGIGINIVGAILGTSTSIDLADIPYALSPDGDVLVFALASGSLPDGAVLNSDGTLDITYAALGAFNFTINATDAVGVTTQSPACVIVVIPATLPATEIRVQAVTLGFYNGEVRFPGDVFDLLAVEDFSDSSVNYGPQSGEIQLGWMKSVSTNVPLFSAVDNSGILPVPDPLRRTVY